MAEYFGSEFQIAIQKRLRKRQEWIRDTPEIANGGRILNFLDPARTGWDRIRSFVEQDGAVAITAQDSEATLPRLRQIFTEGYTFPRWDIYLGTARDILARCRVIRQQNPTEAGWHLECLDCPDDRELDAIQALNAQTGVAPAPAFYSRSEAIPSLTACLWAPDGTLAATSSATARYHPDSRLAGHVFKGSTSVDPAFRGKGLGKVVNAHVLIDSQRAMGWSKGISQVAPDNPASQKTIAACGFVRDPDLATFGIMRSGEVFTR